MQMNIIVMYRWAFLSFLHVKRHLYSVKVQLYPLLKTDDCIWKIEENKVPSEFPYLASFMKYKHRKILVCSPYKHKHSFVWHIAQFQI